MNNVEYTLDLLAYLAQQPKAPAMIHDIVDNGDELEVYATFPANPEYDVITSMSVAVVGARLDVVTISTLEPAPGEYAGFLGSVAKGVFTALTADPHRQHLDRHRAALVAIAEGEVTTDVIAFFAMGNEVWCRTKVHAKDLSGHWQTVPMIAPLDECIEHDIHPALTKADAMVRGDAQKAWANLMQVGQQIEVARKPPLKEGEPMNDDESMKPPNPSFSVWMSFYSLDGEIWYEGKVAAETTDQVDGWQGEVLGLLGDPPHAINDSIDELPEDLIEAIRARVGLKAPRAWADLQAAIAALKSDKGESHQF